jgi:hypothetical protein
MFSPDERSDKCMICATATANDTPYTTCYPCTYLLATYVAVLRGPGGLPSSRARIRGGRLTRTSAPWPTKAPPALRDVFQGVMP